jgi:hypothetical protein
MSSASALTTRVLALFLFQGQDDKNYDIKNNM